LISFLVLDFDEMTQMILGFAVQIFLLPFGIDIGVGRY
jgi:hypothetical protein